MFPPGTGGVGGATGGSGGASGGSGGIAGTGGNGGKNTSGGAGQSGSAGSTSCTPHACLGVECGVFADGCGATVDCGDCGSPGMTCIKQASPMFQNAVKNAVEQCKTDHPDYFDFNNTNPPGGSDNVAIVSPDAFDAYVCTQVGKAGVACISDPNDTQEIRVRGSTDAAENYRIRVLAGAAAINGYSAYKYQSTCSPAGF